MALLPVPNNHDVERAFYDAMTAAGFNPGPIQTDTREFVRFDAPGDKPGRGNGFYKLALGKFPVGWFGDWKSGEQHQWQWDYGRELTQCERKSIADEQRRLKAEAQIARETKWIEVSERASNLWKNGGAENPDHPYLKAKGIEIPRGIRTMQGYDGTQLLIVPMYAFDEFGNPRLMNLQTIGPDGFKRFLKAGRVEGCFFSLKGDPSLIVICEGVATGFSIWMATGASVVCAFNAGNLVEVTKEFSRHRKATLLIAADNDAVPPDDWAERGGGRAWSNAGVKKAEAAAKAVGCRFVAAQFADGPARGRTDYNDLHRLEGLERVKSQILHMVYRGEAEPADPGATVIEGQFVTTDGGDWRSQMPMDRHGGPDANNVEAVALWVEHHGLLANRLSYNQLAHTVELDGKSMEDHHVAQYRRVMHGEHFKAKKQDIADEMLACARRNIHDPLADYLNSLKWDGKNRLSSILPSYFGTTDDDYHRSVGRKMMIGAVARALKPGCKNDTMMVLEGGQGIGKSTAIRYLFQDRFFIDHLPDFHSKDSFLQLQGAWVIEVAELSALSKADVKDVKQFLSRVEDKFRPPYAKMTVALPRRCVFVGTVNPDDGGYLRDPTGARRFWPVECGEVRLPGILRDRDQLWAEAVQAFNAGEVWHLTEKDEIEHAVAAQVERREIDPWESALIALIKDDSHVLLSGLTIEAAMSRAARVPMDRQDARLRRRMGTALRAIGWADKVQWKGGKAARVFYPGEEAVTVAPVDDRDPFLPDGWE